MKKQTTPARLINFFAKIPTLHYLLGIGLLAVIVRLISITKASFWHDEAYTAALIQFSPAEIIARTTHDVHPPLYYLITHFWQAVFGSSELAIRGFSLMCGVALVIVVFFIVRRLFNENVARLSALFLALGPFLVRYSEEARMYSLSALFVCLATLLLLVALEKKRHIYWMFYGLLLAAMLYTHYFTIFIIPVHIGYAVWQVGGVKKLLANRGWWIGNGIGALCFLPWVPSLLGQLARVQAGFWIPEANAETIQNTFMQFMTFTPNTVPAAIESILLLVVVSLGTVAFLRLKHAEKAKTYFLLAWLLLPIILVVILSLRRPIYVDRYFAYCSIAFYILLALFITQAKTNTKRVFLTLGVCTVFLFGISSIYVQAAHKMRDTGNFVNAHYQPGDGIVSAELYTYFDFTYYNKTGEQAKVLYATPFDSYGETSLIHDKNIRLASFGDIPKTTNRIWIVGKTGTHDYYTTLIPTAWQLLDQYEAGDSAVRLYKTR